jgi:hypothetical protein
LELLPFDVLPCARLSSLVVPVERSKRRIPRVPPVVEELESNAMKFPSPDTDGFALDVVVPELPLLLLLPPPPQLGTIAAAASKSSHVSRIDCPARTFIAQLP